MTEYPVELKSVNNFGVAISGWKRICLYGESFTLTLNVTVLMDIELGTFFVIQKIFKIFSSPGYPLT